MGTLLIGETWWVRLYREYLHPTNTLPVQTPLTPTYMYKGPPGDSYTYTPLLVSNLSTCMTIRSGVNDKGVSYHGGEFQVGSGLWELWAVTDGSSSERGQVRCAARTRRGRREGGGHLGAEWIPTDTRPRGAEIANVNV